MKPCGANCNLMHDDTRVNAYILDFLQLSEFIGLEKLVRGITLPWAGYRQTDNTTQIALTGSQALITSSQLSAQEYKMRSL